MESGITETTIYSSCMYNQPCRLRSCMSSDST